MTLFVQPLDAGIIRCFKAHYRRAFCARAIDLNEAGERNIYKINLLKGMMMAKEAWAAVNNKTICTWDIICDFVVSEMTFPVAKTRLCEHLGDRYDDKDWRPALNAVMDAEGDAAEAQDAIQTLAAASQLPKLTIKLPGRRASNPQIKATETALMESVNELVKRN
ncbi:hypothetical protein H0H87_012890 [Tephrocybe sp. NHM501043]|nr:hypothetical protein H0H87_012890 [Tephrocybe sp. NHM501043]